MESIYQRVIEAARGVPYRVVFGEDPPRTATFESVGEGIRDLLGVEPETFTRPDLMQMIRHVFVLEPALGHGAAVTSKILKGPSCRYHAEMCLVRPDGELRWVSDSAVTVTDERGAVTGAIGFLQDITERRSTHMAMIRAQRMEALGVLASGVAHDFNNLLVAILGNAELALLRGEMDGTTRQRLTDIEKAAHSASALTRQLLLHSRRREIERREVDLNWLITELMRMLKRLIGEHIDLAFRPCADPLPLCADRGLLEQAILNLCVNARDEMPRGGHLTLTTALEGGQAVLRVHDTGGGIPEDIREMIFDPFFTTKSEGNGTGLGLATVRTVAEHHGGAVQIEASSGDGTVFALRLPLSLGKDSAGEDGGERPQSQRISTKRVLLAEDEPVVLRLAQRVLEMEGHTVITARDGLEAIEQFENHRDSIDVAVLDIVMPHVNGDRVARLLRDGRPDLPIILSSGYNPEETLTHLALAEPWTFLPKPYNPSDLRQSLALVLSSPHLSH